MQVSQKCKVIQDSYNQHKDKLDELVQHVNTQVKTNELPIIGVFGPEGGHAVVAIGVEKISTTVGRLYIYDCNFPQLERYINLTFDSNGHCIGWNYCVNDVYNWGSSNKDCWITYVPYSDFEYVWRNKGNEVLLSKKNSNVIYTNSSNCLIKDSEGNTLCTINGGVFVSQHDDVFKMNVTEMDDSAGVNKVACIFLPIDQYTIINQDYDISFEAGIVDVNSEASVATTASSVTFSAADDEGIIYVSVNSKKDDSFELTMRSSVEEEFDEITLSGIADGSKIILSEQDGTYNYQIHNCTEATLTVDGKPKPLNKSNMIKSIEVIKTDKNIYTYRIDKTIDKSGMELHVHYTDGTHEIISDTSKMFCSGLDATKRGVQRIAVQYGNASASYDITVRLVWWQWIIRILLFGFLWY